MSSFNRSTIMGNLTRDPEFKQLPSGQAVCRLSLASNRQFRPKNAAEAVQEVCYIDIEVWGAQAENCQKYLTKGSSVLVDGRLKLDSWQDSEGQKRSRHSIVAERVVFLKNNSATDEVSEDNYDEPVVTKQSFSKPASATNGSMSKRPAVESRPKAKASAPSFDDDLPF